MTADAPPTGQATYAEHLSRAAAALDDRRMATRLLEDCAGRSAAWLRAHADDAMPAALAQRFGGWIARVAAGEPEAYVAGVAHFWTLRLKVTPDVLIPRPDTETLVRVALELGGHAPRHVADLGTGSGAVALALAVERPTWQVVGTDISDTALTVARTNALDCALSGVRWLQGDWLDALDARQPRRPLDGIVANPPYVADDDPALADGVRQYEPRGAVIAADDGLADLRRIITAAPARLAEGGWLALEHGFAQADAVSQLLGAAGFADIATHRDLAGHPRVTAGRLPSASTGSA